MVLVVGNPVAELGGQRPPRPQHRYAIVVTFAGYITMWQRYIVRQVEENLTTCQ